MTIKKSNKIIAYFLFNSNRKQKAKKGADKMATKVFECELVLKQTLILLAHDISDNSAQFSSHLDVLNTAFHFSNNKHKEKVK